MTDVAISPDCVMELGDRAQNEDCIYPKGGEKNLRELRIKLYPYFGINKHNLLWRILISIVLEDNWILPR